LAKQVKGASPAIQEEILTKVKNLKNKFIGETGYDIGEFNIKNKKVFIDPKTPRLGNFKSPLNKALQQAMHNFETTMNPKKGELLETKVSKFINELDKKYMVANAKERLALLKKYAGTNIAKESQVLKAFQKVPKIGKIATAIIKGTALVAAMTTVANADTGDTTLETDDKKLEARTAVFPYDIVSAIAEDPKKTIALAAPIAAGAAIVEPKKALEIAKQVGTKAASAFEKVIRPAFLPAVEAFLATTDTPITSKEHYRDVTSPGFWMTKAFWASAMDSYGITKTYSMLKNTPDFKGKAKIARDIFLRAGINPAAVRFISSKIAWPATAAASVYDAYKDYKRTDAAIKKRWEEDPEGMKKQAMEDAAIVEGDTSEMFAEGGIASLIK